MNSIVEALLNEEIDNFPEGIDIESLDIEGKLLYDCINGELDYDDIKKWETLPGDLRLFNLCVKKYGRFSNKIDHLEMVKYKTCIDVSMESFVLLCESIQYVGSDFNDKLIKMYEQFSESGILHKVFLSDNRFHEYLNLSAQYKFTPTLEYWKCNSWLHDTKIYLSQPIIHILGLNSYGSIKEDINDLRKIRMFPDKYRVVYDIYSDDTSLIKLIIRHFNQLTLEEKTIWINIIKTIEFDTRYYLFINDKDTLDVLSEFFTLDELINDTDINYYLRLFSMNCSIIMLEYFMTKFPEHLVTRLKLYMIIHYNDEKIKYFFGEVTQDDIDNLVRRLV